MHHKNQKDFNLEIFDDNYTLQQNDNDIYDNDNIQLIHLPPKNYNSTDFEFGAAHEPTLSSQNIVPGTPDSEINLDNFPLLPTEVQHDTEDYEQVFMCLVCPFLGYLQNAFINNTQSYYILLNSYNDQILNSGMYAIQCEIYCKLAFGAYFCRNFEDAKQFISNARASFSEIFDNLNCYHTASAATCILYYYLITGEISKIIPYESLLSQACDSIQKNCILF
jgi:hypothetical protein